jgi:HlyD family secretion protein
LDDPQRQSASGDRAPPAPSDDALVDRVRSLQLPDFPESRFSARRLLAWGLGLLLLSGAAVYGYRTLARRASDSAAAELPAVETLKASADPTPVGGSGLVLESRGYVIPARQILVSPKVSGMIEKLTFVEGQRVRRDDMLARLETTDYQADVDRAAAALEAAGQRLVELEHGFRPEEIEQARAELAESEAQLVQLEADYKRATELRRQNVNSAEDFDAAESRCHAMQRRVRRLQLAVKLSEDGPRRERIEASRADRRQAEAELTKARWRLGNCTIRAPISGTILKKNAEEGNVVNPIAFNGSFSLCEMADLADLEVELMIQERDVARVWKGQPCKIRPDAWPNRLYQGEVSRLMPIADRAKGAVPVRVKVRVPAEEEGVYLKPEMAVLVSFYGPSPPASPAAPADARR